VSDDNSDLSLAIRECMQLFLQNFTANLGLLLGIIAAGCLVGYAIRVARDRTPAPDRPPAA